MNLTNRLGNSPAGARGLGIPFPAPSQARALARTVTVVLLAMLVFALAGAVGLGLYASSHAGRIYQGISVANLDLSGLTPPEARAALDTRFAAYAETPITFSTSDRTFSLTPAETGAALDTEATVAEAMAWGREGSLWEQSQAWTRALLRGVAVSPVITLDPDTAARSIAAFAPEIVKAPVDAALTFSTDGQPEITPDSAGIRLNYAATAGALENRLTLFSSEPVPLVTETDPPAVIAASLTGSLPDVSAAVDAPLLITAESASWHIPVADLQPLFGFDAGTSSLDVDSRPLRALVTNLSAEVNRDPVDAAITVDELGRLATVPAVNGAVVDIDASVAAIRDALLRGDDAVPLAVTVTPPQIVTSMADAAVARGEAMIGAPIALTWPGGSGELDRADLLRALTIRSKPGQEQPFVFGLDPDHVWNSLFRYSSEFDIPMQNARWRLDNGAIKLAVPESKGREIDLEGGVASVMAAFLDGKHDVTLNVRTILPRWEGKDGAAITLGNDVLGEGGTYYGDSSDSRRQNIEVASSYLSGWLVPPDGVFSYADNVGLITEEQGFVTGYGIVDDGAGGFTTAPVIGGGICQVSTTLFQAVFWSGLPVLERHQHPYYLRNYGEAVTGLPGLDAMVNIESDWRLDLRFKNTTGYWLAVVLIPDGNTVYARIVGTNPGWTVEVPTPEMENIVQPDETMRYTESPELPLGTERLVESARDGFDVTIERTVRKGNTIVLQDSFFSTFEPAHNTTMRGTGTE